MNKSKVLTTVLILILVVIVLTIISNINGKKGLVGDNILLNPIVNQPVKQPAQPSPKEEVVVAPKVYKFDRSTDLEKELDNINPQVLDSDFQ